MCELTLRFGGAFAVDDVVAVIVEGLTTAGGLFVMDMASGRLLAGCCCDGLADESFFLTMVGESSNGLLLLLPVFSVTAADLATLAVGCC